MVSKVSVLPTVLSSSLTKSPSSSPKVVLSMTPFTISPSLIFIESFEKFTLGNIFEKTSVPNIVFFEIE